VTKDQELRRAALELATTALATSPPSHLPISTVMNTAEVFLKFLKGNQGARDA
jgi:hypothetical protein